MRQKIIQRLTELYHDEPLRWDWAGIVDLKDYSMNGLWVCLCRLPLEMVIGITEQGAVIQLQHSERTQKFFLKQVIIPNGNRMGQVLYKEIHSDLKARYYNYTEEEGSLPHNPGYILSSFQDDPLLNDVQTQLLNLIGE